MREIKFRAWLIGIEKMMYEIEKDDDLADIIADNGKRYVLMQYTGLKDKNGKEIYEGDIVKIHAHSYDYGFAEEGIGEIRFVDGCFGYYKQLSPKEYIFNDLATAEAYGELDYYEVIRKHLRKLRTIERRYRMKEVYAIRNKDGLYATYGGSKFKEGLRFAKLYKSKKTALRHYFNNSGDYENLTLVKIKIEIIDEEKLNSKEFAENRN